MGVLIVLAAFGGFATVRVAQEVWPPLGDRSDAWGAVLSVVCGTLLASLAGARIPFDLRWGLLGLPAGMALLPALDSLGSLLGMASMLGGMSFGMILRTLKFRRALQGRPELQLRRLVLPMTASVNSALYQEPSVERALARASRRSWFQFSILAVLCLGAVTLTAWWTYQPSLRPTVKAFQDAWASRDVERIANFMIESQRETHRARLERESQAGTWPVIGGGYSYVDQVDSRSRITLPGTGQLRPQEVTFLANANAGTPSLHTSWACWNGRWILIDCGPKHP